MCSRYLWEFFFSSPFRPIPGLPVRRVKIWLRFNNFDTLHNRNNDPSPCHAAYLHLWQPSLPWDVRPFGFYAGPPSLPILLFLGTAYVIHSCRHNRRGDRFYGKCIFSTIPYFQRRKRPFWPDHDGCWHLHFVRPFSFLAVIKTQ